MGVGVALEFIPSISMKVEKNGKKINAAVSFKGTFELSLGTGGRRKPDWWPKLRAFANVGLQGSLTINGDSATEIFNELMLSLSTMMQRAELGNQDVKNAIVNGIMSEADRAATLKDMDQNDYVSTSVAVMQCGSRSRWLQISFGKEQAITTEFVRNQVLPKKVAL